MKDQSRYVPMSYTNMINVVDNTKSHKNVKKMVYITIV